MRYIDACKNDEWSVGVWKKTGEDPHVIPYQCRSWRHEGACRDFCAGTDYLRICEALAKHTHWTSVVLTYPHREWQGRIPALFKFGVIAWSRLRKRLDWHYGAFKYIQTWEIHKSGYPHVNVAIANQGFHTLAVNDYCAENPPYLQAHAVASGFGKQCWATPLYDESGMAAYLTKLALELHGHNHKDQTPVNAPPHFRRIRASKGLLPKRPKDDTITGQLFNLSFETVNEHMNGHGKPPLSHLSPSTEVVP